MKLICIERYGDWATYDTLFAGNENSTNPTSVRMELEGINHPVYPSNEEEKLYNEMVKILKSHGYTEFKPMTVTISD